MSIDWTQVAVAAIGAIGAIVVAYFAARATGRAAAQAEQGNLAAQVGALKTETTTAREEAAAARELAEKAADDAHGAATVATWVKDEHKRYVTDEKERRRDAREAGQRRDAEMAARIKDIHEAVIDQGRDLAELQGRVDPSGGSRRGR